MNVEGWLALGLTLLLPFPIDRRGDDVVWLVKGP